MIRIIQNSIDKEQLILINIDDKDSIALDGRLRIQDAKKKTA